MKPKDLIQPIKEMLGWFIVVMCILFIISAIALFPIVLSKITNDWLWLSGYVAYTIVAWIGYKVFID